jgi:hypothetical protein
MAPEKPKPKAPVRRVAAPSTSTAGPSTTTVKPRARAGPSQPTAARPRATIPADAVPARTKGSNPTRTTGSVPAVVQNTRDEKPVLNEGEEEWAEMMRKNMGMKSGDWYTKGVKSVQVS